MQLISQAGLFLDVVARAGSFRRAAEQLNLSVSAVNRRILQLEEAVGVPLFERLPRGVRPTSAGERVLSDIRRWQRDQRLMVGELRELQGQRRGTVTIGAMECFAAAFLPEAIFKMQRANPLIEVEVLVMSEAQLNRRLLSADLDLAFVFNPQSRILEQALKTYRTRPGFIVTPEHPLAQRSEARLSDCTSYSFIKPASSIGLRRVIDRAFENVGQRPPGLITTDSLELIKSMLRFGQSVGLLSILDVYNEVSRGDLVFVPTSPNDFADELFCIAAAPNRTLTPQATEMMNLVVEGLDGLLAWGFMAEVKRAAKRRV